MTRRPTAPLFWLQAVALVAAFFVLTETAMRVQRFGLAGLDPREMNTIKRVLMSEFAIEPPNRNKRTVGSWGLMPNTRGWNKGEPFEVNNLGLRGADVAPVPPPNTLRLCAIGGSLTMAAGVPLADTWTVVLETELEARALTTEDVQILNLGVPNTRQCLERHLQRALTFEPDAILWQVGWTGPAGQFQRNFERAARFAEEHRIPLLAFALNEDQHEAASNRFFQLLPPLGVLYGPEHYIYPSDDHPDGVVHRRYAQRLADLLEERWPAFSELVASTTPDHDSQYNQPPLRPWIDPDRGFWHCYVFERLEESWANNRERLTDLF